MKEDSKEIRSTINPMFEVEIEYNFSNVEGVHRIDL